MTARNDVAALEAHGVSTSYGEVRAIHDVSLDVRAGSTTAVLGRNGAGKTTLLRAIAGLNRLDHGAVRLHGEEVGELPASRRVSKGIAYVQEGKRIFRGLTVEQNLVVGTYAARLGRAEIRDQLAVAYERFPVLSGRRKSIAASLSGGQQQMLAIAQALMSNPTVLLLDEPSGGLAPSIVAEVMQLIERLVDDGMAIVLVEQALNFAMHVADQVVVIDIGRVALRSTAGEPGLLARIEDAYFGAARA